MPIDLSVNLNAIAYLRNRRNLPYPDMVHLGQIALKNGAAGLTVHPRPDERHSKASDCYDLKALIVKHPQKELNLEGFPDDRFLELVHQIKPDQVTLVPDDPAQATSDHGWDLENSSRFLAPIIHDLQSKKMRVSLFIDPNPESCDLAAKLKTDRVELFTGPYGMAYNQKIQSSALKALIETGKRAKYHNLGLNAGHDLNLNNLPQLAQAMPFLDEVSIGHGLTADCLIYGLGRTVKLYLDKLRANN